MNGALLAGCAVLERAIAYALGSLALVTPPLLGRPTPCARWDLEDLLRHFADSMAALQEATEDGRVELGSGASISTAPEGPGFSAPSGGPGAGISTAPEGPGFSAPSGGPGAGISTAVIPLVRDRAVRLLGAWAHAGRQPAVRVGDALLTAPVIAGVGAIEVTVHGWDVAQACGQHRPIPAALAGELLDLAVLMVRAPDRPGRFGRPLVVSGDAPAGDRLLAYLGRRG